MLTLHAYDMWAEHLPKLQVLVGTASYCSQKTLKDVKLKYYEIGFCSIFGPLTCIHQLKALLRALHWCIIINAQYSSLQAIDNLRYCVFIELKCVMCRNYTNNTSFCWCQNFQSSFLHDSVCQKDQFNSILVLQPYIINHITLCERKMEEM